MRSKLEGVKDRCKKPTFVDIHQSLFTVDGENLGVGVLTMSVDLHQSVPMGDEKVK